MEGITNLRCFLNENKEDDIRKIEMICLKQINETIEKVKWKANLDDIKRDTFAEGLLSEDIKKVVYSGRYSRKDQIVVAGR